MPRPRLIITPGEPAGIGPDICLRLAQQDMRAELLFIVDPDVLQQRANRLGIEIQIMFTRSNAPAGLPPES